MTKTATDPRALLARLVEEAGSQKAVAKRLGITQQYIGDLLAGQRTFSDRILDKLGLTRVIVKAKRSAA